MATSSSHQARKRLWWALRLPDLPAHALGLAIHAPELQVIAEQRQVVWISSATEAAGVHLGMDATTAQMLSGCVVHERNPMKEQQLLAELAEVMYQFSPFIELYTSDSYASEYGPQTGLLLEISSCLLLFGGVQSLGQKITHCIASHNISLAMGAGHSKAAAWLLSFVNYPLDGERVEFIQRLSLLPIGLLHDFPRQVDALDKTGFVTLADIIRQIEAQSISSFKKRFDHDFVDYLCELFGIDQDFQQSSLFEKPVTYFQPGEFFAEEIQFDYPLHQHEQLQVPMETLLQKLAEYLRKRQLQTQHIEWVLSDIYHNHNALQVYADSPQTHWRLLFDLSLIQLENRDLPFEVDRLSLNCRTTLPLQARNNMLEFDAARKINRQHFSIAAAKLKARLGDAAVYKLSYRDGYLPNDTNQRIALTDICQQELPDIHRRAQRPNWLLDAPAAVEMRKQGLYWRGKITLIAGPERIQGNWWREPSARDYFIGLRQDRQRLWLFWDLHKQQWFVQGIFA